MLLKIIMTMDKRILDFMIKQKWTTAFPFREMPVFRHFSRIDVRFCDVAKAPLYKHRFRRILARLKKVSPLRLRGIRAS